MEAFCLFFGSLEDERSYDYRDLETRMGPLGCWLLINLLGHADIIEYGTSPRFGWLTPAGRLLRDYVASHTPQTLYDVLMDRDEFYVPCFPDNCQCEGEPCRNPLW